MFGLFIENIGGGFIPGGKFRGGSFEKSMVGGIIGAEGVTDSGFGGVFVILVGCCWYCCADVGV